MASGGSGELASACLYYLFLLATLTTQCFHSSSEFIILCVLGLFTCYLFSPPGRYSMREDKIFSFADLKCNAQ